MMDTLSVQLMLDLNAEAWRRGKPFILIDGQVWRTKEPTAFEEELRSQYLRNLIIGVKG